MSKTTVEKVIDGLECKGTTGSNCKECQFRGHGEDCSVLAMQAAADLIERQAARIREHEWIPLKWREITPEEKEFFPDDVTHIADCKLPDDGDEILISRNNSLWVSVVEFCNDDYGVGDSDGNDWLYDVDAWMPLPKGYQKPEEVAHE